MTKDTAWGQGFLAVSRYLAVLLRGSSLKKKNRGNKQADRGGFWRDKLFIGCKDISKIQKRDGVEQETLGMNFNN